MAQELEEVLKMTESMLWKTWCCSTGEATALEKTQVLTVLAAWKLYFGDLE